MLKSSLRKILSQNFFIAHSKEFFWGTIVSILLIIFVTALILYRNWRYEQELDSLLWKIDYKEIEIHDDNARIDSITQTDTKITPTIVISADNNNPPTTQKESNNQRVTTLIHT